MTSEAQLERRMRDLGRDRYRSGIRRAREQGRETTTIAGQYLLKEAVARVGEAAEVWIAKASTTTPGPARALYPWVSRIPINKLSLIACKVLLDSIARGRKYTGTALAIGNRLEDEDRCQVLEEAVPPQFRDVARKHRNSGYHDFSKAMKQALGTFKVSFDPWPRKVKVKTGAILIEMFRQHTGLIQVEHLVNEIGKTSLHITPDPVSLAWIEKSHEEHESLFPFYLPTLEPPKDWESIEDGGYHTEALTLKPMVKPQRRSGYSRLSEVKMPAVYSAINTVQQTAWEVNPKVYEVMTTLWDSEAVVADLPLRSDQRVPKRPDDYEANPEAAKAWRRSARLIMDANRMARSHRVMTSKTLFMAKEFLGSTFYYPMQLDFRGRMYPRPYFLQPQGPSQSRGLLRFAQGKPVQTEQAWNWWYIHGANCFGVDKVPFKERIEWVDASWDQICLCGVDPLTHLWWAEADKPWEFLAFCLEAVEDDKGGLTSKLPIQMDGSNNGLQIFSLLLRDEVGGKATNCTPSETPQDIYQEVADVVTEKLQARREQEQFARDWLGYFVGGRLPRKLCKRPVMVLPYGGTQYSCHKYVMEWVVEERRTRELPWPSDYYTPSHWLSKIIWESIGEVVVAAKAAMKWLQEVSNVVSAEKKCITWTSPSGFPVLQGYTNYEYERIQTYYGDTTRNVRLRLDDGKNIDSRKQRNGIAPNYVHSLDAAAMVATVNLCAERGMENFMMIHDSFGTTAADAPLLAEMLRRAYVEIFSEDQLARFRDDVAGVLDDPSALPELPPYGSLDVGELTSSLYFFA